MREIRYALTFVLSSHELLQQNHRNHRKCMPKQSKDLPPWCTQKSFVSYLSRLTCSYTLAQKVQYADEDACVIKVCEAANKCSLAFFFR